MSEATRVEKVDIANSNPADPDLMFKALEDKIAAGSVKMDMRPTPRLKRKKLPTRSAVCGYLRTRTAK